MNKIDDVLIHEAKDYVTDLLTHDLPDKCLFHTIRHTLDVLKNAEIIGRYCGLKEDEMNTLRISALFHDVGYIDSYDNHEAFSAERAANFLASKDIDMEVINQVQEAILSTRTPQSPQDNISSILCDADLMNLTFDDYFEQIDLMREEWAKVGRAKLNRVEFHAQSLEFFHKHAYHSAYGKLVLQPMKEEMEMKIRSKVFVEQ